MSGFKKKKITKGQVLSDKLKKARLENDLSLLDLQEKTKIQEKYLKALEDGEYEKLPGDVYARTWIKVCAKVLNLPVKELLDDYSVEKSVITNTNNLTKEEKRTNSIKHNILKPRVINFFIITLVLLSLLGYLVFEVVNIIKQPQITITEPVNNFRTTDNNILIKGTTEIGVELKINNETILLNNDGLFEKNINLSMGLNNLIISVKKKHSRTNNIELTIFRESLEEEDN